MSDDPSLEATLRTIEPALRLVHERHLRKVLNYLRDWDHAVPSNPDLPLWVDRNVLLAADVLPAEVLSGTEPRLLLITNPADRLLDHLPRERLLHEYWRLLFQAAIVAAIDRKLADRTLTPADCGERLNRFRPAAAREIRYVLETDHHADPKADDAGRYRAFAALYLDLLHFAPAAIAGYFPSLPLPDVVQRVLGEDLDIAGLHARSRPTGAADPDPVPDHDSADGDDEADAGPLVAAVPKQVADAEREGNLVRAAILSTRAGTDASPLVARLVAELASVTGWSEAVQQQWRDALGPVLAPAAAGHWPRAARCLYELQKIPRDAGREVFVVDLIEWARTLGRRPVKRPLPHGRVVILLMHLKAARRQLVRSRVPNDARDTLDELLHAEIERTEHDIREAMGPVITAALTEAGFRPTTRAETVARDKVVAELLDRVCDRGQLRIGDLRDAVARNQLKMPDLGGAGEFSSGDPLLLADTRLAYGLDGVYRRGEFYLRWLQRFSSVFFGTAIGRAVFLYLILPFVAAFMTVVFAQEVVHLSSKAYGFVSKLLTPRPPAQTAKPHTPEPQPADAETVDADNVDFDPKTGELIWPDRGEALEVVREVAGSSAATTPPEKHQAEFSIPWVPVLALSIVFLLLFHAPPVRRVVFHAARMVWAALRVIVWDLPRGLWHSPIAKAVRHSRVVRFIHHYLLGALLSTAFLVGLFALLGAPVVWLLKWGSVVLVLTVLLANTRWGWVMQERLTERLSDALRLVRVNLIPGLFGWVVGGFRWLANWFERRLYAVDEWLRFRGGDSQGSLAVKAALGLIWFPIAYVFRFAFYLLIEPQINPVKHFPVVTVSHKVILPMFPTVAEVLNVSNDTAFLMVGCVPGIFGFAAWELMANWRLYRANRPQRLRPVVIGSHGETVRGLLRPGFHSGTVPRLFRQVRKAERKGKWAAVVRYHHELEHAVEGVHRFVDRELVHLLKRSPEWGGVGLAVASVQLGCQRVVVELSAPELGADGFAFSLENRGGQIEAAIEQTGWADKLTETQRGAFVAAMRGLFDMAAAELFEGKPREPDAHTELARPWTWDEWVKRWEERLSVKSERG